MDAETDTSGEPPLLTISVDRLASGQLLAVAGELDFDSADLLKKALDTALRSRPRRLVVDCSGIAFCDSTGLNLLLKTRASAEEAGGELVLVGLAPIVARLFEVTGVRGLFREFPTVEDALAERDGA